MIFSAMRPDFGFSNGRDVSLFSVAQALPMLLRTLVRGV